MSARNVLVTGASSGIGRALSLDLVERGWTVYASVRSREDGRRLRQASEDRVVPLRLDLEDPWLVREAAAWLDEVVGEAGLQALVNNAGIATTGPIEGISGCALRRQFEVNVFGAVSLAQALLPCLRRGSGRVVNIGSSSGRVTLPFAGPYSASKAALAALTAAMRMEWEPQGVQVSLIESGNVRTPIWSKTVERSDPERVAPHYRDAMSRARALTERMAATAASPAAVVRAVVRAMEQSRPRPVYVVGHDARLWRVVSRFVPIGWLERGFRGLFRLVPLAAGAVPSDVDGEEVARLAQPTGATS